jgi:hypothetical protein
MIAVGLIFYSLILIVGTWVIARRPKSAPKAQAVQEIANAQAEAVHQQVAEQGKVLTEIDHDVAIFNLADYLNDHKPN